MEEAQSASDNDRLPVRIFLEGEEATKSLRKCNIAFLTVKGRLKQSRDVTGIGVCLVCVQPLGGGKLSFARWKDCGPTKAMLASVRDHLEEIPFEALDELPVPLQFLLACGPLADLPRAQDCLERMIDGNCRAVAASPLPNPAAAVAPGSVPAAAVAAEAAVDISEGNSGEEGGDGHGAAGGGATAIPSAPPPHSAALVEMELPACTILPPTLLSLRARSAGLGQLRAPGAGLTALEWAAKSGSAELVRWLLDDERTHDLLHEGSPLGWACYAGHVEIARTLLLAGADARATDQTLWRGLPPMLAAAEGGQRAAFAFLLDEARVSIHTTDEQGLGVLRRIQAVDGWEKNEGLAACEELARARGAKKQFIKWK